jgi:hypothetical protein
MVLPCGASATRCRPDDGRDGVATHPAFSAECSMAENAEAVRLATDAAAQYVPEGEVAAPGRSPGGVRP